MMWQFHKRRLDITITSLSFGVDYVCVSVDIVLTAFRSGCYDDVEMSHVCNLHAVMLTRRCRFDMVLMSP